MRKIWSVLIDWWLGLEIDADIVQGSVVGHTRASGFHRLVTPAAFVGEVRAGADNLIVDDHFGMGGTIANLKGRIESNSGRVVLATTLTASRESNHIALRTETGQALRKKHGDELERYWHDKFGHGFEALTKPEAGYLLRTPDAGRIRDRITAAEREGVSSARGGPQGEGRLSAEERDADSLRDRATAAEVEREWRLRSKGVRPPPAEQARQRLTDEPAPEAGFSLPDALSRELESLLSRIAPRANLMALPDVFPVSLGAKQKARGCWLPGTQLVMVALSAKSPEAVVRHEAIHALRSMGLFTEGEWKLLENLSRRRWRAEFGVDRKYRDITRDDEILTEEGVAHAFEHWRQTGRADPRVKAIFRRIMEFLERLGNLLRGHGFQTADDVFGRVESGAVGARKPQKSTRDSTAGRFALVDPEDGSVADEAQRARAMQGFIARGHPLDRALRIPFHHFGGVNKEGEWTPGRFLSQEGRARDRRGEVRRGRAGGGASRPRPPGELRAQPRQLTAPGLREARGGRPSPRCAPVRE